MKKLLFVLFTSIIFISSCSNEKEYKYIDMRIEKDGNDPTLKQYGTDVILAESDSSAYMQAFNKFCFLIEFEKKYLSEPYVLSYLEPRDFKLFNERGIEISDSINNIKIDSFKNEIQNQVLSLKQYKEEYYKQIAEEKKERIKVEIKSINKGIDFSMYRGSVDDIKFEIILFETWGSIITEGLNSEDYEMRKLAKQLKNKVKKLQINEFPRLRKNYGKVLNKVLWENDIGVYSNGYGKRIINFTGGIFVTNSNKQEFQNELQQMLTMLRFTQSRYRWYKGENTYTYYKIYTGKDSDLVSL